MLQQGTGSLLPSFGDRTNYGTSDGDENPRTAVLAEYWRIARRWKWYFAATVIAALALGVIVTMLSTPLYRATARIEIAREGSKIVKVDEVTPESTAVDQEFYQTQYGLLESTSLADAVGKNLQLLNSAPFFETFGTTLERASRSESGTPLVGAAATERRKVIVRELLLDGIRIEPVRGSRLIDVSFVSPDAALSARVANAWTAAFIRSSLDRRFDASSYARTFLEGRLQDLRARLEQSERLLVDYASREQIVNLAAPKDKNDTDGSRSVVADDLSAINAALSEATSDRIRAQSRFAQVRAGGRGAVSEALQNPAISQMRERRAVVASEYAKLLAQFEPGYPPVQALASQIADLDRSIAREEGRVVQSLQSSLVEAQSREKALTERVGALTSGLIDLRRRSIQYNIYQRDVDTNRELYDGLLQRYKEIGVAAGVGTNNISIVDPADRPDEPASPRLLLNMLIALVLGLGLGGLIVLVLEQLDDAINDPASVLRQLGLPLLGTVPVVADGEPVSALADPKSPITDAYLSIQTSLSFSTTQGVPATLAITSTRPSEGKSTTSFALAQTLVRLNKRTLLIDADMRSPSIHYLAGIENGPGLSNLLAGDSNVADVLRRPSPEMPVFMTAGPQPPNAAQLLTDGRLAQLLDVLLDSFDHILIDCPPVLGLADAPLIASQSAGTVFAIESHGTRLAMVRVALQRVQAANANIVGAVVTKFEPARSGDGYGYGYGYSYGYGDSGSKTKQAS